MHKCTDRQRDRDRDRETDGEIHRDGYCRKVDGERWIEREMGRYIKG